MTEVDTSVAHSENKPVSGGESDGLWIETGVRTWSLKWSLYSLSLTEGVKHTPVAFWLGAVFVSQQTADTVLRRLRRYNSGFFEEVHKANLERECKEETCTMEEAREVFEDIDKTMAFWSVYIDGDQCQPPPCQNGGVCDDGISTYTCYCQENFNGKNCEIEMNKQCFVNNGGCSHFCFMTADRPVCKCATGYKLGPNKRSCEPTEQFSCGYVQSSITPRSSSPANSSDRQDNSNYTLEDDFDDEDIVQFIDYDDFNTNDSNPSNISAASAVKKRSVRSDSSSSVNPAAVLMNSGEASSATETEKKQLPSWAFFPTLPTITAQENTDQRIVGGDDANPGEIPWQVALMSSSDTHQRAEPFCGGSLLNELWVITAAHCLVLEGTGIESFFVRVGEHDVSQDEGPERNHEVAEQHMHPTYNAKKSLHENDIALLKLAIPVELSNQRRPICLGPKDFIEKLLRDSSSSLVSGWGKLSSTGRQPTTLKKLEVPYVDRTVCKQSSTLHHITRFMFCAGYQSEQKDSCKGDSGGPHATYSNGTWFLTGIVSWGEECALEGKYGVYTRVARYYSWIFRTTRIRIIN
ncbi:coagulation factor IX-like isoform X1 [Anarrhichthys ocellatus]|uniref:coagulation factor IX-like isoform X1 n=1 Tax=Anarrhichthys ocellatus TaxID=433405 RepID=UPI0012EE84B8|nr:coagulation factor IX-like isoform X1 [Anarrhichthys ocellatus]